jgi:hypothetical protein
MHDATNPHLSGLLAGLFLAAALVLSAMPDRSARGSDDQPASFGEDGSFPDYSDLLVANELGRRQRHELAGKDDYGCRDGELFHEVMWNRVL